MNKERKRTEGNVTVLLTGDIMLGGEFLEYKNEPDASYEYSFRNLKSF